MSRAFVKEDGPDNEPLPDLPISPHPNYVTPRGLAALGARLAATQAELLRLKARRERLDRLPEKAAERLKAQEASPTALLLDPTGEIGRRFGAKVTPDMRIIDPEGKVAYAGAIDSLRGKDPAEVKDATNYIAAFLDSVLAEQGRPFSFHPPYG